MNQLDPTYQVVVDDITDIAADAKQLASAKVARTSSSTYPYLSGSKDQTVLTCYDSHVVKYLDGKVRQCSYLFYYLGKIPLQVP